MTTSKQLVRPSKGQGRMIAGVCSALADRFGLSVGLVRIGFLLFGLFGAGEIAYILLWLLIPKSDTRS